MKRWEALTRFVDDGLLEIDSILIENDIRPSALEKKNWLFVGHPEAGERSAVICTLLGSCRRHGINPFEYLKDLLTRLPAGKITDIHQFTPSAWARAKAKEKLIALAAQTSRQPAELNLPFFDFCSIDGCAPVLVAAMGRAFQNLEGKPNHFLGFLVISATFLISSPLRM